jgi:hypothetical protein
VTKFSSLLSFFKGFNDAVVGIFTNNCYNEKLPFAVSLNGCFFLFPIFCFETKGGAKNSSRFKNSQSIRPTVASVESAIHTSLMLYGPQVIASSSCYAKTQKALDHAITTKNLNNAYSIFSAMLSLPSPIASDRFHSNDRLMKLKVTRLNRSHLYQILTR